MVIVSTIDARAATIQVLIMPDFADEVEAIIKDLQGSYDLQEIPSDRHGVFPC